MARRSLGTEIDLLLLGTAQFGYNLYESEINTHTNHPERKVQSHLRARFKHFYPLLPTAVVFVSHWFVLVYVQVWSGATSGVRPIPIATIAEPKLSAPSALVACGLIAASSCSAPTYFPRLPTSRFSGVRENTSGHRPPQSSMTARAAVFPPHRTSQRHLKNQITGRAFSTRAFPNAGCTRPTTFAAH